eukprot:13080022-Alexandrium_andersonii.AAC.1
MKSPVCQVPNLKRPRTFRATSCAKGSARIASTKSSTYAARTMTTFSAMLKVQMVGSEPNRQPPKDFMARSTLSQKLRGAGPKP